MATTRKLTNYVQSAATIMSTAANSLADGSLIDDAALDNASGGTYANSLFADFRLSLASLNITAASAYVALYLVPSVDGTNYPHYTTGASPKVSPGLWVGNFFFNILNGAQAQSVLGIQLPPGLFKPAIVNKLGVAFASSGNTLQMRTYNEQMA